MTCDRCHHTHGPLTGYCPAVGCACMTTPTPAAPAATTEPAARVAADEESDR